MFRMMIKKMIKKKGRKAIKKKMISKKILQKNDTRKMIHDAIFTNHLLSIKSSVRKNVIAT